MSNPYATKKEKGMVEFELKGGMTASRPADTKRYHVLAHSSREFMMWVRASGKSLQACNYIGVIAGMQGISFVSPEVELVVVGDALSGKGGEFVEAAAELVTRYCLEKRVSDCIRAEVAL